MSEIKKEIIIVGAGPAGLTAAMYAKRANKDIILLEPNLVGGQLTWSSIVENYPGFESGIKGMELAEHMRKQVEGIGVSIISSKATEITQQDSSYLIKTEKDSYQAQAIIISTGAFPKKLNVPGESDYIAKGVSYCATCDAPLFKNKIVAVIGGGDVALEEALYLSEYASKVYLIHRRQGFRAAAVLEDKVKNNKKIELILDSTVESIEGDKVVKQLEIKNKLNQEKRTIELEGVFIFIGLNPNSELVETLVKTDEDKLILTDESMACSVKGVFAAGDVRRKEYRQIVLACADGAIAGLSASRYINENCN
ncbi:MAG: thioredoxin-disulfide reductase [Candidatus Kappaea frigidicola]|nr:thioredoxin-disulfide reductase [Candidatus Kappaea frigidicola]